MNMKEEGSLGGEAVDGKLAKLTLAQSPFYGMYLVQITHFSSLGGPSFFKMQRGEVMLKK